MEAPTVILAILILVAAGAYIGYRYLRTWFRMRGPRLVICPETHQPEEVLLDAVAGAKWATVHDQPATLLRSCTRWPERLDCDQACLYQIDSSENGCRVTDLLSDWYRGKDCAFCGDWFEDIPWLDNKPAFLRKSDRKLIEWNDVAARALPQLFNDSLPVCWKCYIAESFRKEHPDLVTDRPEHPMFHG